jgi:hypothetical protein
MYLVSDFQDTLDGRGGVKLRLSWVKVNQDVA